MSDNAGGAPSASSSGPGGNAHPGSRDVSVQVFVPQKRVKDLLGVRGRNVLKIKDISKVYKISVLDKDKQADPVAVEIRGNAAAVEKAKYMVEQIAQGDQSCIGNVETAVELEPRLVSKIIGTNGEVIEQMKKQTGAWLAIRGGERGTNQLPKLTMTGSPEAVALAKSLVQEYINQHADRASGLDRIEVNEQPAPKEEWPFPVPPGVSWPAPNAEGAAPAAADPFAAGDPAAAQMAALAAMMGQASPEMMAPASMMTPEQLAMMSPEQMAAAAALEASQAAASLVAANLGMMPGWPFSGGLDPVEAAKKKVAEEEAARVKAEEEAAQAKAVQSGANKMATSLMDRLRANRKKTEESTLTVTFRPGKVGVVADREVGLVTRIVENGQAEHLGVKVGMRLHKLNGMDYSQALLGQMMAGQTDYTIVFELPKA